MALYENVNSRAKNTKESICNPYNLLALSSLSKYYFITGDIPSSPLSLQSLIKFKTSSLEKLSLAIFGCVQMAKNSPWYARDVNYKKII